MKSMLQVLNKQIESPGRTDLILKRWEEQGLYGQSREIYWRHHPSIERYYTELNASFVVDYSSIESMATFPIITLRDGYYGLLYFFVKNPKPIENFNTLLLIPSKFSFVVPKGWKKNILLYEFQYNESLKEIDSGIFTGIPSRENFLIETADQKLKNSFAVGTSINCNVYGRDRFISPNVNEQKYFNDYKKALYKKFGFEIHDHNEYIPLNWSNVDGRFGFYNLDSDHFLIYSDYLNFVFASKGASFINKPEELIDKPILSLDVSPYHKIKIGEASGLEDKTLEHLIKLRLSGTPLSLHSTDFYEFAITQFILTLKNEKGS